MTTIEYIINQLEAPDRSSNSYFAESISMDGNTAVVGAHLWDRKAINGVTFLSACGCVYVFIKSGTEWTFQQQLFANDPSDNDNFGYGISISGDTIVVGAASWDRKVASGVTALSACGKAYVFVRNGTVWSLQQQLLANDPSANDLFGYSVSISENTIVVGAFSWDRKIETGVTALTNCGCAYIFTRNGILWSLQQQLLAHDASASDSFARSLEINNNTIVVGANGWDSKTNALLTNCGCVYVYIYNGSSFVLQQQLFAYDPSASDVFGNSIAIDGNTIVVGANSWDRKVGSINNCGCAYVFIRNDTQWIQEAQLVANDPFADDNFGNNVAISGNIIVIGAHYWGRKAASGITALTLCGAAYVFSKTRTRWTLKKQLLANDPTSDDRFGQSVGISTDTVLICAPKWDRIATGLTNSGVVYTVDLDLYAALMIEPTVTFIEDKLLANDPTATDNFGLSIAIDGNTAVVGAHLWDRKAINGVTFLSACGCAYVYVKNGVSWSFQQQLFANDPFGSDNFGYSVSINNGTIVIGAYGWDRKTPTTILHCGAVYIYINNGIEWIQQQQLLANDLRASDNFGWSVAISNNTIVVGAPFWDRKVASGVTALDACGCIYIYIYNGIEWILQQQVLANDPSASDQFGSNVAISNNTVVVGVNLWDRKVASGVTALDACGCAYVFIRSGTVWSQQQQLIANDPSISDKFGQSVEIHNDTIVIGAPEWDRKAESNVTALIDCGCAYIFVRNGEIWDLQQQLFADDLIAGDAFGYSVSLSGNITVISALNWDRKIASGETAVTGQTAISNCGAVYVFIRNNTLWTLDQQILANDPVASDNFGYSVDISYDTVVIGAYLWDQKNPTSILNCGAGYITNLGLFTLPTKNYTFAFNWTETKLINGNIGIGTSTPNKTLDINGDLNISGSLYNNNNAIEQWLYNSNMDTYYNNGNIGIGTNNPNYLLDINGDIKANTFIDVSDIRLKEEIVDDTLSIEFINSLTPKSYTYINNDKIRHGLIAQELLSLGYSNFVNKDLDGYYTIHMISLLGPMINSLKDLSNKNEILKNKLLLLKK